MALAAPPEILYHYTSLAGLRGIVERQELWATTVYYLNDELEFYEALMVLEIEARARLDANPSERAKNFLREHLEATEYC